MTMPERVAPSRVLVAFDGSPAAATALPWACMVAGQLGAAVEILHVSPASVPESELPRRLHLEVEELDGVQLRLRVGEPAATILQAAAEPDVALLALTTHGRAIEPGRHLGRVAEAVVARTIRPILLVRPEATIKVGARPLRRLLVPLDCTPTTATALRPVTELACRMQASIDLLYVFTPQKKVPEEPGSISLPRYVDQPQHEWPQWAHEAIDRLCRCLAQCPERVPVHMFVARGDIEAEILRFAATHEIDATALVRRSHLEPGRARVLRTVLDHMTCPVLIVGSAVD